MKKYWNVGIILLFLCNSFNLLGQQTGKIENGFNTDNFPNVSFVYHSYDPSVLEKSDIWYLKESGSNRDFSFEKLPNRIVNQPQNILILWEDMAHNGYGQYDFTKKTLLGFFNNTDISTEDRFAISTFNRRTNTNLASKSITNGFSNDRYQLIQSIEDYQRSSQYYQDFPNRSDMYTAIREGLEQLAPLKNTKAIIVFTSGYSMKNSGADSEVQVLLKAQQLHIPVYIFQYYYRSGVAPEAEGFAKSTFGGFYSHKDARTAETALINLYSKINTRYQGHNYKITFTSNAKRNDDVRMVNLSIKGIEIQEQLFPPTHTFKTFAKEYPWVFVLAIIVFAGIVTGVVLFVRKTKQDTQANRETIKQLEEQHIKDVEEARQQQIARDQKAKEEIIRKQKEEEENRLRNLMAVKNVYPRLKCNIDSNVFTYEISKPITTLGRENSDVILPNHKVSRQHAKIVFNGSCFEIVDDNSTNGVWVNGQKVSQTTLRSGDTIILGDVIITFI